MGASGMYPGHPHYNDHFDLNRPYYSYDGHSPIGPINPYSYYNYPNHPRMGYMPRVAHPYPPYIHGPMGSHFRPGMMSGLGSGRGGFNVPRQSPMGGMQTAPPSMGPNGNLQVHRPHFDEH